MQEDFACCSGGLRGEPAQPLQPGVPQRQDSPGPLSLQHAGSSQSDR